MSKWKPVGNVGTFTSWTTPGQAIEGVWVGLEPSTKYDSQIGRIEQPDGSVVAFSAGKLLVDRLKRIKPEAEVRVVYTGTKTSKAGQTFKNFDVFVAEAEALVEPPAEEVPF